MKQFYLFNPEYWKTLNIATKEYKGLPVIVAPKSVEVKDYELVVLKAQELDNE